MVVHNGISYENEDNIIHDELRVVSEKNNEIELCFNVRFTLPNNKNIEDFLTVFEFVYNYIEKSIKKITQKLSEEIGKQVKMSENLGAIKI